MSKLKGLTLGYEKGDKSRLVRVSDLMVAGKREWDKDLVYQTFNPFVAGLILKIALDPFESRDKIVWHWDVKFTWNCQFRGKSETFCGDAGLIFWGPKFDLSRNEWIWNCFRCWKICRLSWSLLGDSKGDFNRWWIEVSSGKRGSCWEERIGLSAYLMCPLWKARNDWVFQKVKVMDKDLVEKARQSWGEFIAANSKGKRGNRAVREEDLKSTSNPEVEVGQLCITVSIWQSSQGSLGRECVARRDGKILKTCTQEGVCSGSEEEDQLAEIKWCMELARGQGWTNFACLIDQQSIMQKLTTGAGFFPHLGCLRQYVMICPGEAYFEFVRRKIGLTYKSSGLLLLPPIGFGMEPHLGFIWGFPDLVRFVRGTASVNPRLSWYQSRFTHSSWAWAYMGPCNDVPVTQPRDVRIYTCELSHIVCTRKIVLTYKSSGLLLLPPIGFGMEPHLGFPDLVRFVRETAPVNPRLLPPTNNIPENLRFPAIAPLDRHQIFTAGSGLLTLRFERWRSDWAVGTCDILTIFLHEFLTMAFNAVLFEYCSPVLSYSSSAGQTGASLTD
ncbi:alpha/beta-Hydrolases superfamily protein [Striga asiatica]|uniref:Alpha/beta-Hydrolases superfamily protein n=1 Tax=Striga asiatica TaxID=4170 RepID=A0A5A7PYK3_STRAF|nr:alpha/beta-Hydrolases superfamily protein [Striga asiatica]